MNYENLIKDFANRTRKNLVAIRNLKSAGADVFDLTQLINSLLGLLVFPRERYVDRIPATPLNELAKRG